MVESDLTPLEAALERIGSRSSYWLWLVFILTAIPGLFNAMHIMSYIFLTDIPGHWCEIQQLVGANWTKEQIKIVSTPNANESSCSYYNWNYTHFAIIGYEESISYIKEEKTKPSLVPCQHFQYDEKYPKSSIVSEWDLVCENASLRSFSQAVIAFGKFIGGFLFGVISDKYGRKCSFVIASIMYMMSGPIAALVPSFVIFNIARFAIGVAGSGVYETSYTILTEITVKKFRTWFGCVFNMTYPLGYILLPIIALISQDWRELQLYISIPVFICLLHFWFLPESPRWLISHKRPQEAWKILEKAGCKELSGLQRQQNCEMNAASETIKPLLNEETPVDNESNSTGWQRFKRATKKIFSLYSTGELRRRILVCYIAWFTVGISYFSIALNADNFTTDKYIYCALNGVVEAPGYVLSVICLSSFGRKPVSSFLFIVSGISLLVIIIMPKDYQMLIIVMALLGRFCVSAVSAVIILQTSELFPTVNRNSAIGTSLTVCQLGAIAAPYIVDLLGGKEHWYMPSTVCGALLLATGLLVLTLPETKDKQMKNTIEEIDRLNDDEKISFKLCCKFK